MDKLRQSISADCVYKIADNWDIGKILSVSNVLHGKTCSTFLLHTSQGKFILRGVQSSHQAEVESAVFHVLTDTEVTAELIKTKQRDSFICDRGVYYNLQSFVDGKKPDLRDENQVYTAAAATSKIHKALSDCSFSAYDRFSTIDMLNRASKDNLPGQLFPENVITLPQRQKFISDIEKLFSHKQIIHGDLGDWNMLWDGNKIYIIDFGECRAGDIHFDLAAVICSILYKCGSKEEFTRLKSLFIDTYNCGAQEVNGDKLDKAVYLWLLRGALVSNVNVSEESKKENICRYFLNQMIKYKEYEIN